MKYKLCSLNDLFGSHIGIQIERRKIKERSRHSENQAYWIEPEPTKLDERKEIFDDLKILQKNARTHNVPTGDQHVIINDCILRNVNYIINQKKNVLELFFILSLFHFNHFHAKYTLTKWIEHRRLRGSASLILLFDWTGNRNEKMDKKRIHNDK